MNLHIRTHALYNTDILWWGSLELKHLNTQKLVITSLRRSRYVLCNGLIARQQQLLFFPFSHFKLIYLHQFQFGIVPESGKIFPS